MSTSLLEKVGFVFSLVMLVLLYGFAANKQGWFPNPVLERAWEQAQSWYGSRSPAQDFITPRVHYRAGTRVMKPEKMQPGLTLITSFWKDGASGNSGFKLINARGKTVHQWKVDRATVFPDSMDLRGPPERRALHGAHLFPNGDVLFNVEYVGTVRLDACGGVLWLLPEGNHHSIARAEDGSFWIPSSASRTQPERRNESSGYSRGEYVNQIQHVTAEGEVLQKIDMLDVLRANDLERYIARAYQSKPVSDITHLNDVEPLASSIADEYPLFEAGDLVVSLRNINLVLVFDPKSKQVKWHSSSPFIRQHDPDFMGNGWIGVFNNNRDFAGGEVLGGTTITAVQPSTDSTKQIFPVEQSPSFYTSIRGDWQHLENGNVLLNEAQSGRVLEVTSKGEVVWLWAKEPYDFPAEGIAVLGATRHDLTREDVRNWDCSSTDSTRTSS